MGEWDLRLRAVLDEQVAVIVAFLVVLALLGGWVTYATHVNPGTTTEQRTTTSWETRGTFDHSATVVRNNSVFPVGTTLANRSVYFTRLSPRLDGTFAFGYDTSGAGRLNETITLTLVLRGVEQTDSGANATVLWRTSRSLESKTVRGHRPGQTVRVPFELNASAVSQRLGTVRDQLGATPGETEVLVRAHVDLQGTVQGEDVDRSTTYVLPLSLEGTTYRVQDASGDAQRYASTETVAVETSYGPLRRIGGPALLLASLAALVGVVVANRDGGLTDRDRERLAYADDRSDFDEWVVRMHPPDEILARPRVEADSLGDLVDLAIDSNNSVIEIPGRESYCVIGDEFLYTYEPPSTASGDE
ncbi:DUF5305 domain-containing protein [Haloarculaceae archaeon H-GB1-1]|nr:DUF5305 domain-containing protein [Haloarculaceae archaeon H-GB1-1]